MATKKILGLDGGKFTTIGSDDTGTIAGSLSITKNLTVAGDIISGGSTNVVVQDQFLDLGVGAGSGGQNTGITFSVQQGSETTTITSIVGSSRDVTVADSTGFAAGDIVVIYGSDDASNDGLYAVSSVPDGTSIILDNTNQPKAAFLQTAINNGGNSGNITTVDLTVLAVSDGTLVNTAGGTIPAGALAKAYYADATVSNFVTTGYDEVTPPSVGTPGLTDVYGAGDTLTTSGSNPVEFQLASGNFVIQQGQINIGDTAGTTLGNITAVSIDGSSFTAGANRALSSFAVAVDATTGITLQSPVQASGAVDINITDMPNNGTFTVSDNSTAMAEFGASTLTLFANKSTAGATSITRAAGASGDDLTISVTGANDSSLILTSAGTGSDAVSIDASNAAGGVAIVGGTNGLTLDFTSAGFGSGDGALSASFAAASTLDVAGANLTLSTTTSGTLAVTSAAALTISGLATTLDASTLSIDSTDTSNLTMTANDGGAKTLTIAGLNGGVGDGFLALNAKTNVKIQNGGNDKINVGGVSTIFSNTIQADGTAGFQFGSGGQNVVDIVNSGTGISPGSPSNNKLATESAIVSYADTSGITNWERISALTDGSGGTLAVGDVVAVDGSGQAIKADADGTGTRNVVGICVSTSGGIQVVTFGHWTDSGYSLTAGAPVYLDTTAGGVTSTAPTSGTIYQIGMADSATSFFIQLQFIAEII